ncbi:MAG: UDP-N-acetylmuramoyl-L-alanine--D-glutamate ligase [Bifidobacteriaceae bacterium]|nr:UDP-N-acetylmuramoyl-L-alanine--D-glutamate ligase [Bifidobacteriaceae bacterium]
MRFDGQRVGVAGLGVSGQAVVGALEPLGVELTLIDDSAAGAAKPGDVDLASLDLLIVSPGWLPSSPLLRAADQAGLPVWAEVELAWRLRARPDAPWLAVTGTNGKTTTVEMLAAMVTAGGVNACAAGNVGTPLVQAAGLAKYDAFAVELSSFQLHYARSLRPAAAAVLNLAPDHIDWHGSLAAYHAAKARIYQGVRGTLVYNAEDPAVAQMARTAQAGQAAGPGAGTRLAGFALRAPRLGELGLVDGMVMDRAFSERRYRHAEPLFSLDDLSHLAGPAGRLAPHLVADALAATALALAYGTPPDVIAAALRDFQVGRHRLEEAGSVDGVRYVNDSKATNAHAAAASLSSFAPGSVVWVAGGLAKGASFGPLVAEQASRIKAVVLIGLDHAGLAGALAAEAPGVPVTEIPPGAEVMTRAVAAASQLASPGDVVLLAPAGASMDQFESYADRGRQFGQAVAKMGNANGT